MMIKQQKDLAIDVAAVTNLNNHDNHLMVFKTANDAIVPNSVTPKGFFIAPQRFCFGFRVRELQCVFKKIKDTFFNSGIELGKVTISRRIKNQFPIISLLFIRFHDVASFLAKKILSFLNVNILHKKQAHQRSLLLFPKGIQELSSHKNFWNVGFFQIRPLSGFLNLQVVVQQAWEIFTYIKDVYIYNMYNNFVKNFGVILIGGPFFLTACSTVSESFDTEASKGVGARSISQVNGMIDRGEIPGVGSQERETKTVSPLVSTAPLPPVSLTPIVLSDNTVIHRQAEQVMRIWIAPFQDASGNFFEASVVHTVHRPSFWSAQLLAPQATDVPSGIVDSQEKRAA